MRTILEVIDGNTGRFISSADLLERDGNLGHLRMEIKAAREAGRARYKCSACGTPLIVAYGGATTAHFKHQEAAPDCGWYEGNRSENWRSQKYKGRAESQRHETVRSRIFNLLMKDASVSKAVEEQWVTDDLGKKRKPDIACNSKFGLLHIEVQVSAAIFDEVVYRINFDIKADAMPVWVFDTEAKASDFRTFSDIVSQCHYNAIVFDDEAFLQSLDHNQLLVKIGTPRFNEFGSHEGFKFNIIPFNSLRVNPMSRRLILRCGYRRAAVAIWYRNRRLISDFRRELQSSQLLGEEAYDLVLWKLLLEATSSLELDSGCSGRHNMKYLLMVCESLRKRSPTHAVGHTLSLLWAIGKALEFHPKAARAIYRIAQRYWPAFIADHKERDAVLKLKALARGEQDRSLNRLLRVLYPLAASELPLS